MEDQFISHLHSADVNIEKKFFTYQNLNSGNRLMKGRNSSLDFVGNDGPSSGNIIHHKYMKKTQTLTE